MSAPAILEGALLAQAAGFAVHYQRGKRAFDPVVHFAAENCRGTQGRLPRRLQHWI